MAAGIFMIIIPLTIYFVISIVDSFTTEMPPIEDDEEFWEYHVKLAGITDPRERKAFEAKKKRELIERQKRQEVKK